MQSNESVVEWFVTNYGLDISSTDSELVQPSKLDCLVSVHEECSREKSIIKGIDTFKTYFEQNNIYYSNDSLSTFPINQEGTSLEHLPLETQIYVVGAFLQPEGCVPNQIEFLKHNDYQHITLINDLVAPSKR